VREPGALIRLLADERATRDAGAALARALAAAGGRGLFVTLRGDLGAGKTTLVRGLLEALGVGGVVRSPTYTLVETYALGAGRVHHLDWYRLGGAEDLDGIGFRDLQGPGELVIVEWPERIAEVAATADLAVELAYAGDGRRLVATGRTPQGEAVRVAWSTESG
jgi:tRNA threonylcarbamoyladenosine biosynthesis protein TsaE